MKRRLCDYVESGRFETGFEAIIDRLEKPLRIFAIYAAGVLSGVVWMIAQ